MNFEVDDLNALSQALNRLTQALKEWSVPDETVFDSKLIACELLSNVLQHGGEHAYFAARLDGNDIKISVRGERPFRPPERSECSNVESECGRGLFLVDALSESRTYSEHDGICVVIKIKR